MCLRGLHLTLKTLCHFCCHLFCSATYTDAINVCLETIHIIYTVKPAHAVTCIKRSPFSWPVIENFIWIEPLLRGHLSYKATFSVSQRWPLITGLTIWLSSMRLVTSDSTSTGIPNIYIYYYEF